MYFNLYKPTETEQWINAHYQTHGIHNASDMDIEAIGESFGIEVHKYGGPSFADWKEGEDGYSVIVLNRDLSEYEQRAQFFHELAHPLRHVGLQDKLPEPFVQLQEMQAASFQLAAALPVYMLREYRGTQVPTAAIAEDFKLPVRLIEKRLEQIRARMIDRQSWQRVLHRPLKRGVIKL